jgi:CSLREA domain-containing protein
LAAARINYFRAATVLAAFACAAIVAVTVAYGTASAQSSNGTNITVNTTLDEEMPSTDGKCSLREAVLNAKNGLKWPFPDCAAGSAELDAPQTIKFAEGLSGKVTLGSELPAIDEPLSLTIDGSNARITISGDGAHRVFSVTSGAQLTLRNLTVAGGEADLGGGTHVHGGGTLKVVRSTFSRNTATSNGGGIFNDGTLAITNSTFSNNSAETLGGGIFNDTGAQLTVTHGTFWSNTHGAPERGGGILSAGTATLRNTIVAGSGFSQACSEHGITDGGYNISDDDSCSFDQSTSRNSTDPKLASTLANNGGPTRTIALLRGSPALNAIPTGQSGCATATGRIATDQRGVRRPQGTACDIGAYEKVRRRH